MPSDNKENKAVVVNANPVLSLDELIDSVFPADLESSLAVEFAGLSDEESDSDSDNDQLCTAKFGGFCDKKIISKLDEVFKVIATEVSPAVRLDNNTKSKIAMVLKIAINSKFDFFKYFKHVISHEIWFIVPNGESDLLLTCYLNNKLQSGNLHIVEIDNLLKLGAVVDNETLRIFLEKMRSARPPQKPVILFAINRILSADPRHVLITDKELLNTTLFHVLTAENDISLAAVRYLVARVNINARHEHGETYFDLAAKIKDVAIRTDVMSILNDRKNYIKEIATGKLSPEPKSNAATACSRSESADFKSCAVVTRFQTLEQQQIELDSKIFTTNPKLLAQQLVYAIRFGTEHDAIACIARITERGCCDALLCRVQDRLPFEYVTSNKKDLKNKLLSFFPYHQAGDNATLMDLVKYRITLNDIVQEVIKQKAKNDAVKISKPVRRTIENFNKIMMCLCCSDYIAAIKIMQQTVDNLPSQHDYAIILKGILRNIGITDLNEEKVGDNRVAQQNLRMLFTELCHCNYGKKYWGFAMPTVFEGAVKSTALGVRAKSDKNKRIVSLAPQIMIHRPIKIIDITDDDVPGLAGLCMAALKKAAPKSVLIKPKAG